MYNFCLLLVQISLVCSLLLLALRLGQEVLVAFLSLLAICMNLFVIKQMNLLGLQVTCTEALTIGYLLGFNLMQEFYGNKAARRTIWITFFCSVSFMLFSQVHLIFAPSPFDHAQEHYAYLFHFLPRLVIASIFCFLAVQFLDLTFFAFLRKKLQGKHLTFRIFTSLIVSQALDTVLFSFLGLYGVVEEIFHVMLFSFCIKLFVILCSTPFIKMVRREKIPV